MVNRLHDLIYGLPPGTRNVTERAKTTQANSFRGLMACNTVIGIASVRADQPERSGISRSLTIPAGICSADISFEHFPEWHRHSISFRAFSRNGTPFAFLASGHYNSQSYRASRRALLKNRAWFRPIVALADEMNHLVERLLGSVTTDDGRRPPIGCRSAS